MLKKTSRAVIAQLLGIALIGGVAVWASRYFPIVEIITRAQHKIGQMQLWGAVLYPFLFAGCNLLLLPGGVIAMGGGLFFGLWWGFVLVLFGNLVGAAVAFKISRLLGRQWVERKVANHQKWAALDRAIGREGWKIIVLSQIHPLFPTSLLNYMYGITKIRFWPCMAWIAVGQTPGLFLYCYLGTLAQLGIKLLRGKTHPHPLEYVIWIGGLLLTLFVTTLLARIAVKLMREIDQVANRRSEKVES